MPSTQTENKITEIVETTRVMIGGREFVFTETHMSGYTYTWTNPHTGEVLVTEYEPHVVRSLTIDGRGVRRPKGTDAEVIAKMTKAAAVDAEDAEILPSLIPLVCNSARDLVTPETLAVGDVASVHAMGHYRRGLVTKVTASRVEIAYTTASSDGRVFRKMTKVADALVAPSSSTEPVEEVVEAEATEVDDLGPIDPVTGKIDGTITMTVDSAALDRAVAQAEANKLAACEPCKGSGFRLDRLELGCSHFAECNELRTPCTDHRCYSCEGSGKATPRDLSDRLAHSGQADVPSNTVVVYTLTPNAAITREINGSWTTYVTGASNDYDAALDALGAAVSNVRTSGSVSGTSTDDRSAVGGHIVTGAVYRDQVDIVEALLAERAAFRRQGENAVIAERVGRMVDHWGDGGIEVEGNVVTYLTRLAGNDRRVRITVEVLDD